MAFLRFAAEAVVTVLAASEVGSRHALESSDLPLLFAALQGDGRAVVAPTVRDGAIVYDVVRGIDELPAGWTSIHAAGRYRLEKRADRALFGYTVGPTTWRRFLDPPQRTLFRARRNARGGTELVASDEPAPRFAFLGVRPCDLAALAIHDRVFLAGPCPDESYAARREAALVVAVQCEEPAATCFCGSMGTGPTAASGFDLALTELVDGERHVFLVEVGSVRGGRLLGSIPLRAPTDDECGAADGKAARAGAGMGRSLDTAGLRERLAASYEAPHWDRIAARCLGCASCTLVCPTCFCSTVADRASLDGKELARDRRWDSCFTLGFTHIHGGSHRATVASRYRQWLTHKLSTWHDQFGTPGCVGCGRCIAWCPAGIDITEEARAVSSAKE
jgi:sulfhydrogenase subunit beta (sulfur reductase)